MENENLDQPVPKKSNVLRFIVLSIVTLVIIAANFIVDGVYSIFAICGGEGTGCQGSTSTDLFFIVVAILEIALLWVLFRPKNPKY